MKKVFVCLLVCALLLSCGALFASADLPGSEDGVIWSEGKYLGGSSEMFSEVGNISVTWSPDFQNTVDLTDGDLSDWYASGLTATNIDAQNMIAWVGDASSIAGDFKITTFSAADSAYLYLAFDVVDESFVYGEKDGDMIISGDTIQLSLDLGGKLRDALDQDPNALGGSCKGIFYTFSCREDGAPIRIMRQESEQDAWLSEANGDGVKGAARKTDRGWSVELAFTWQQLYDDYCWKAWDDPRIYLGHAGMINLRVEASLYYFDYAESGGYVNWAAGAVRGLPNALGVPCVSWTAYDNAIAWELPVERGMSFDCESFSVSWGLETILEETEPPYDPPVEYPDTEEWVETENQTMVEWYDTISPEVEETLRDAAESLGKEDEINAILEKYGCTSTLGLGSLAAMTVLAAAAFVIRKKK